MTQLRQKSVPDARRKFWIQLLAFAVLALLFYLKPRIESWVHAQQVPASSESTADQANADIDSRGDFDEPTSVDESGGATESGNDRNLADVNVEEPSPANAEETDAELSSKSSDSAVTASVEEQKPAATQSQPVAPKKKKNSGSPITKMERTPEKKRPELSSPEKNNPPPAEGDAEKSSDLGKLKEIDDNVFESTAGLVYVPGGAEGHRLKHVMQHAKDNPSKPVHGVFDGDRDEILAVIDEAFMKARKGGSDVRSEKQNGRRVITVNLRRRIGQVGGSEGERQGHPDCRFIRIVLENENEVISAYPSKSF